MLKKRIITAFILTIALMADVFLPMVGFAISIAVIVGMGAWEWANLAGIQKNSARGFYVLTTLLVGVCFFKLPPLSVLCVSSIFWICAFLAIIYYPTSSRYWGHTLCRSMMGLIALPAMGLSFLLIHEQPNGAWLILILWAMVALADIGAYFVGHACGNKKLAPLVSPGKTREGAYGGLCIAASISFAASFFYSDSMTQAFACALVAMVVTIASIIGDLLESMLKRFRGIKDSGNLLPGHGGVLDRIDGWTAAAPAFAFFILHLNVVLI